MMKLMRMVYKLIFILVLSCVVMTDAMAGKTFYVFTDNNGKTHIQDSIPPAFKKNGYRIVSENGVTLEEVPAQGNRASVSGSADSDQQAERDQVLLRTFTNAQEIVVARDNKLGLIESAIATTEAGIASSRRTLLALAQRKKELLESKQPVPEKMESDMAMLSERIEKNNNYIQNQRREQARVRELYDADIARFKKLMGVR